MPHGLLRLFRFGSGPPDFCPCTLKVPRSAVGSRSGRPEPARLMSQLGRVLPFSARQLAAGPVGCGRCSRPCPRPPSIAWTARNHYGARRASGRCRAGGSSQDPCELLVGWASAPNRPLAALEKLRYLKQGYMPWVGRRSFRRGARRRRLRNIRAGRRSAPFGTPSPANIRQAG
jgi:hypothetical protein